MSPTSEKRRKKYNDLPWQSTTCVLCGTNCGIEVKVEDRHIVRVRGDEDHPVSAGYLCQKAARIDYYQNHLRRLEYPLKRQSDGSFARIDWQTAIPEMLVEMQALETETDSFDPDYPFILASGERRDYNANQIMRDPGWRRNDPQGALRIHPQDARLVGVGEGNQALCDPIAKTPYHKYVPVRVLPLGSGDR